MWCKNPSWSPQLNKHGIRTCSGQRHEVRWRYKLRPATRERLNSCYTSSKPSPTVDTAAHPNVAVSLFCAEPWTDIEQLEGVSAASVDRFWQYRPVRHAAKIKCALIVSIITSQVPEYRSEVRLYQEVHFIHFQVLHSVYEAFSEVRKEEHSTFNYNSNLTTDTNKIIMKILA